MQRTWYLQLLLFLTAIAGCAGTFQPETRQDEAPVIQPIGSQLVSLLPPLPQETERETDIIVIDSMPARNTYNSDELTQVQDDFLVLSSTSANISWAIWQLNPGSGVPQSLSVQMSTTDQNQAYFAISNFIEGCWEFVVINNDDFVTPLDAQKCQSAAGNIYVAGITCRGDFATIESLGLNYENGWITTTLKDEGFVGDSSALAVVGGKPAIVYHDGADDKFKYIRSSDASGLSWGTEQVIEANLLGQQNITFGLVGGNPAACFQSSAETTVLRYARSMDVEGTNWIMTDIADYGSKPSLNVVNGYPAVSYYLDYIPRGLRYVRATDATGEGAWETPLVLTGGTFNGTYPSLAVEDGMPIITYVDQFLDQVKLIGSTDQNGVDWNPPQLIDTLGMGIGYVTACGAIVNSGMTVGYGDIDNSILKFARYNLQAAEWEKSVIDGNCSAQWVSLAVIGGVPAMCYYDSIGGDLKYVEAKDNKGTAWGIPIVVDGEGDVGAYCSLAEVDGRPAISYFDGTNRDLKYAIRAQ